MAGAHPTAHLRVVPEGTTWRVVVGDQQSPPVEAVCPAFEGVLELPTSPVLVAGSDASLAAREAAYGQALAEALRAAAPAWAHLQLLRGRAEAGGRRLVLAVDGPADVGWELLPLGAGSLEASDAGVVVRWVSGAAPAPRPVDRRAAVWQAADDEATRAVGEAASRALEGAGFVLVDVDADPSVLWVVAHGERGADALEIALGAGSVGAGALSATLSRGLGAATLVVLGVCHGASGTRALVGATLAADVPVVVAPEGPVPTDVLERFAAGLAEGFGAGGTVADAVAAGRRAVRAWAFPHPLARWSVLRCFVGHLDALHAVPSPRSWAPEGWPRPGEDAARWLAAARADALARTDGYVGIDHLLRTLAATPGGATAAATLRRCALLWLRPYEEASAGLLPQPVASSGAPCTPRLGALGASLAAGFGLEALAATVLAQPSVAPRGFLPDDAGTDTLRTLDTSAVQPVPEADALEVVGGPEDGRIIALHEDLVIGRAGGDATVQLYAGTRLTDRKLSRRHLTWQGGRLASRRPLAVEGPDGRREADAPIRHGDLLHVTASTRLRAVARG